MSTELTVRDVLTRASRMLAEREHTSLAGAAEKVKDMTFAEASALAAAWQEPPAPEPAK